jgi:hypothetical protein
MFRKKAAWPEAGGDTVLKGADDPWIDVREPFKGYNVPRPHHALGDRPPLPEAIRGAGQQGKGQRAANCANESIQNPRHPVATPLSERSTRFPFLITSPTFFPRRVGLIPSGRVLLVWFSPSTLRSGRNDA